MKFFVYVFALVGLAGLSSAAAIDSGVVDKRDVASDEYTLVNTLYNQILQKDANINATAAKVNLLSGLLDPNLIAIIRSDIQDITSQVNAAASSAATLKARSLTLDLEPRQITNETLDLADILATLLTEVDNTINPLLVNLGLGPLVNDLIVPLEDALTALVSGVGAVVDGLVAALTPILDALTSAVGVVLGGVLGLLGL